MKKVIPEDSIWRLFSRVKNPIVWLYAFWQIFLWFCRKLIVKVGFTNILIKGKMPAYLSKKRIKNVSQETCIKKTKVPFELSSENLELPTKICLAGQELKISDNRIPWQTKFDDIENLFALHRWGWLLRLLFQFPSKNFCFWASREIEIWLDKFLNKKQWPIWEAYSVSERIINGILFFNVCSKYLDKKNQDKFIRAISEHAQFLKNHLEYYGEKKTNNHLLNNARALYFAGQFLQNNTFSNMGRLIWLNELPKMLTASGFLREESSHYHFLLSRSTLEVWWLAKQTNDFEFAAEIGKQALKMIKKCYFFLIKNNIDRKFELPLIGDVSPDFPPSWLMSVPFSKIAADLLKQNGYQLIERENNEMNWARLFDNKLFFIKDEKNQDEFYIEDGWLRLNRGDITIFWPIKPKGAVNTHYHGHNDLNSFCLYYRGQPIIVDPGRYNFNKTKLGRYGRKAGAHNSILIDNQEQFILDRFGILPFWALAQDIHVEHKKINDGIKVAIKTKKFYRTFLLEPKTNTLMIKDKFLDKGKHHISSFFHLAPGIQVSKINNKKFLLKEQNLNFDLQVLDGSQSKSALKNDYFFPAYGRKIATPTITFDFIARFPVEIKYQIKLP